MNLKQLLLWSNGEGLRREGNGFFVYEFVTAFLESHHCTTAGSTAKPEELYHIIEHFAQGMRRIELFGEDHNIRAGWVTVGKSLTSSNFNKEVSAIAFAVVKIDV